MAWTPNTLAPLRKHRFSMEEIQQDGERDLILEDPETACWLDGPLNPAWFRPFDRRLANYRKTRAAYKRRRSNFRKILENLATCVRFMTWILHVTAALAYPMLASTLDNNLTKN